MDPTHLMRQRGTWVRRTSSPTERDGDGNPTIVETRRSVRCWVAPSSSSENADRQNVQTNRFVAYLPPSAALAGPDQLEVAGVTYEAEGPSEAWTHPLSTLVAYRTCPLRLVR